MDNCVYLLLGAFLLAGSGSDAFTSTFFNRSNRAGYYRPRSTEINFNLLAKKTPLQTGYTYRTLYFDQKVDHFGFAQDQTFKNRSLAASAPIWQFTGITPCNAFYDVTTATWARASETCVANANKGYSTLEQIGADAAGLKFISSTFRLCDALTSMADVETFKGFLSDMYVDFAMVDYPYPASFLADLPAWPIKEACKPLLAPLSGKALLEALSQVTNLYFNYTGAAKCVNWKGDGGTPALGYLGWDYQSCTEMVMPMCSNGTGMFYKMDWDFQVYSDNCFKQFGVRPRKDWIKDYYWGTDLSSASNIIF
ncbi:prolylcarboxypeptidase (Angiotensinase C), partial [Elysia marginata]